jgi:hypothetical protein
MHSYILYPTKDEGCDFGKYPPWRFNPIFSTLNNSKSGEQQESGRKVVKLETNSKAGENSKEENQQ